MTFLPGHIHAIDFSDGFSFAQQPKGVLFRLPGAGPVALPGMRLGFRNSAASSNDSRLENACLSGHSPIL